MIECNAKNLHERREGSIEFSYELGKGVEQERRVTHDPGVSGIMTLNIASFPSPSSARSAMNLNLEKLMLAPETTETNRLL